MDLSIIIPSYNGKEYLKRLLSKIAHFPYEIIIVDNGSTDKTVESIQKLKIIRNKTNLGYAGGCNAGAKSAKGKYLLFLNNDCLIEKDSIERMVDFLDTHKEYIATQPIILNQNKQVENIGQIVDLYKLKGEPVKDAKYFEKKIKNEIFENQYFYSLVGTCLMVRKEMFMELSMFDESFHSYHEDIDFFIRASKKRYRYFPTLDSSCIHAHMGTSGKMGAYKQIRDFTNLIKIIVKNYPLTFTFKHFLSLFIERLRNLNGIIKKMVQ